MKNNIFEICDVICAVGEELGAKIVLKEVFTAFSIISSFIRF